MASTNPGALILTNSGAGTDGTALDIRDIKGPIEIAGSYWWLAWVAGALLVALLAWWIWRKYFRKTAQAPSGVVIPPHRKAKDRLRAANDLISDPYAFCSLVSDVVRTYLEERFELHAPERTTEEFLGELHTSLRLTDPHKLLLQEFLTACDLVKFARHEPTETQLRELLDAALRLIDETTVIAPTAQPEAQAR